ncbi:melanoma cell adhesion molecule b isoform X2 [Eleginops maclovinus]|uniref:melanoma cell adhesion molecule b isoform X2 n=1 Tax=Eleginops maclovinus TaxID=56733 RepID=UPI00308044E4
MAARDTSFILVGLLVLFHTWGAWADVKVKMEDRVEVFRGEPAQIACTFTSSDGIGGMIIQWFYVNRLGEKQKIYLQNSTMNVTDSGTPFTQRISVNGTGADGEILLTISDVQPEDELEFICLIKTLTDGTAEGRTKLKVFATPDHPTIEGVQTGISINEEIPSKIGTCEVKNGYPKPNITWYRNNTPIRGAQDVVKAVQTITTESSGLYSVKSELNMKVMKVDVQAQFYCEVTYFIPKESRMTETNRINITVYYPTTSVIILVESPKGKIKEGDSIELHCYVNGNMPSSIITISHEESGDYWENKSVVLENVTRQNSGYYYCNSTDTESNSFEEVSGNTMVFVNYLDPAVVKPENVEVLQGDELMATCNALSSLQTQTVWFKDGKKLSMGHSLNLKNATIETAGTYMCVVTVSEIEGMETKGTLTVNVQGPPQILGPDFREVQKSSGEMVNLSCDVIGYPAPTVVWYTSDGKSHEAASETDTKGVIHSVVNITITSDITAICNASNNFGTVALTFNIIASKRTPRPDTTTTNTAVSTTPNKVKKEGKGVIIAVIIICILLLAILGSVLYFLYKKGKICGRSGKQDLTKEVSSKDNIVVEMKSDNTEEAVLLGVNGEKLPPSN